MFKDDGNRIQAEDRPVRLKMAITPEMLDSVNSLIFADRRNIIEEITEQLEFLRLQHQIMMTLPLLWSVVEFRQDNARPHNAARTMETISQFDWQQLPHPCY